MKMNLVMAVWFAGVAMMSAAAHGQSLDDLRRSFEARYPQLVAAKQAGKVGENASGYVEAVKGDTDVASLINAENADRRKLYDALAKKEGIAPEVVAERNALRNFAKASSGEWLKGKDGRWTQKQ